MCKTSTTIFLLLFSTAFSQNIDLESILETETESQDQVELLEYMHDLIERPLNLNTVSAENLRSVPWITDQMVRAIIKYRKTKNGFRSVTELLKIKEIDNETFSIIQQFFIIDWQKSISLNLRQRTYRQHELSQGFQKGIYAGGPEKYYTRLKGQIGDGLYFGLLSEKDPGESRYTDHVLANMRVKIPQIKSTIYLGNFIYEAGQGLVFWGPYRFTKGTDPVHAFKQPPRGLVSFTSASEFGALKGVAVRSTFHPIKLNVFYSYNNIDASIINNSVSSIAATGLHRTTSELNKENSLTESIVGIAAALESNTGYTEFLFQSTYYNRPFMKREDWASAPLFSSHSNFVSGVNFNYFIKSLNVSGEVARSKNGAYSSIANLIINFNHFDMVLSVRKYSPNFQNLHSLAFGNTDESRNEDGIYLGMNFKISRQLLFSFYFDSFKHKWPKYLYPFPSAGMDQMLYMTYKPNSQLQLLTRLRIKTIEKKSPVSDGYNNLDKLLSGNKYNARIQIDYRTKSNHSFRSRIEYNFIYWKKRALDFYALQDTTGFLLYNQISTNIRENINIKCRLCFFDAPSYDVRFYTFENDVPGIIKLKMLQHRGRRFFLLFRYKLNKKFSLYAKYEQTYYDNRDTIGSGNNLILSNTDNASSLQLEWRY
jgi:hypothetical protein